jgi:hypothetical protein
MSGSSAMAAETSRMNPPSFPLYRRYVRLPFATTTIEIQKVSELSGNVYENKGSTIHSLTQSGNVYENKVT